MKKLTIALTLSLATVYMGLAPSIVVAGGNLDINVRDGAADNSGRSRFKPVGIFWDRRCMPTFSIDINSLPNAGSTNQISRKNMIRALKRAGKTWTNIPTSYIKVGFKSARINNAGERFDFVNTITFEQDLNGPRGKAPSVKITSDAQFDPGEDIDRDGDSDVFDPRAEGRNTCFDADGDGDIEYPAGQYKAGTILDADILMDRSTLWTTDLADITSGSGAVDIITVALHEMGHSLGLAHSMIDSFSQDDESNATMWPFLVDGNRDFFREMRSLSTDDIAWVSYLYPEGSENSGVAALQNGDRRFEDDYAILRGKVTVGDQTHVGAHVVASAVDPSDSNRTRTLVGGYVGAPPGFLPSGSNNNDVLSLYPNSERESQLSGGARVYEIPVPRRIGNQNIREYNLKVEGVDGWPISPFQISEGTELAARYSSQQMLSSFYSGIENDRREKRGRNILDKPLNFSIPTSQGRVTKNFNVAESERISPTNRPADSQTTNVRDITAAPGEFFARRFPRANFLRKINDGKKLVAVKALTRVPIVNGIELETTRPRFGRVSLAVGERRGNNYSLTTVEQLTNAFVGDHNSFSPIRISPSVGEAVADELRGNRELDVFLVIEHARLSSSSRQVSGLLTTFGNDENRTYANDQADGLFMSESLNVQMELEFLVPE